MDPSVLAPENQRIGEFLGLIGCETLCEKLFRKRLLETIQRSRSGIRLNYYFGRRIILRV